MNLKSPNFLAGNFIPIEFTCDGDDRSPQLAWSDAPLGAKSFAIICDDPDAPAGDWVHWLLYNIPRDMESVAEAISNEELTKLGISQGRNDFGNVRYGGPCPPKGKAHRYFFKLYALNQKTKLPPGLSKKELLSKIEPLIILKAELIGKYQR